MGQEQAWPTLSARASTTGGMVRPSAFAALRSFKFGGLLCGQVAGLHAVQNLILSTYRHPMKETP
jgi:hypothetical protein